MEVGNHNDGKVKIKIENPHRDESNEISTLDRVRITIQSFCSRMMKSLKSMFKYLKMKLNKKEDESI